MAEKRKVVTDEVFRTGQPYHGEDCRDGIWNDFVIYPVYDAQGNVSSVAVYAQDITDRKQAEQQLHYQASLFQQVSEGIIATDLDMNITSWNDAATNIYGWHRDEGDPIQPVYNGHSAGYADYSHGIRLISNTVILNGDSTRIDAILTNPELAVLLSHEGMISKAYYPRD